jgi:hypothetical protein
MEAGIEACQDGVRLMDPYSFDGIGGQWKAAN